MTRRRPVGHVLGTALAALPAQRHGGGAMVIWNWKAALTSAMTRAGLFFAVNLTSGMAAARAAFVTELVLRGVTSGFYGAVTQRFRHVQPAWAGTLAASILLPVVSHSIEFLVHWGRGTQALGASIVASVCMTVVSTAFNLHLMRHGVLTVGDGSRSLMEDVRALPRLLASFLGLRQPSRPPAPQST